VRLLCQCIDGLEGIEVHFVCFARFLRDKTCKP
jgi:hypothetical protein